MMDRRAALARSLAMLVPATLIGQGESGRQQVKTDADTAQQVDRLRDPLSVGRARGTITKYDNDPVIVALERRMRCTCGCTLDIYTCRTTDFDCTYSPALHNEIVERYTSGQTPQQIVDAFVAREGESILMAPPAVGFNLAGYLVPGLVMSAGVLGLIAWISRRRESVAETAVGGMPGAMTSEADPPAPLDEEERDRLRRALEDVQA